MSMCKSDEELEILEKSVRKKQTLLILFSVALPLLRMQRTTAKQKKQPLQHQD